MIPTPPRLLLEKRKSGNAATAPRGISLPMASGVALLAVAHSALVHGHGSALEEVEIVGRHTEIIGQAVSASQELADAQGLYDANPGGANTPIQLAAYGQIAYEIYDELRDAPAIVTLPVSNGTTLAGVHKGFVSLYRRGKTSRIPRMVGSSTFGKNPIVRSFRLNLLHCEPLSPEKIRETSINEPLVNWNSLDGDLALEAIRSSHGWAAYTSDKAMLQMARKLAEQESLNVLPAATAGLISLLDQHDRSAFVGDRYVAILTGRKS